MAAKISDLGMARILNLSPLQISRTTQAPSILAYMSPEVMVARPKYMMQMLMYSPRILGDDNPMADLILWCISNSPQLRPPSEVV